MSNFKQYRISDNKLIPYVSSSNLKVYGLAREEDKKPKLPISEVVVGPQENMDIVVSGIKELLASKGYGSVKVKKSTIPFRP